MFVNIPSIIVEIQQYFVAIYPYFLNLCCESLVCASVLTTSSCIYSCHFKEFFRLNFEILIN
jgi:hypothetical protein